MSASTDEHIDPDSFWSDSRAPSEPVTDSPRLFGSVRLRAFLRARPLVLSTRARRAVEAGVLIGILALLLVYFTPNLILSKTTTTGGDTGAHVYAPWYLRTHLLEKGLVSGWSQGWFAGFPMLHFYFPLVAAFQALASFVIPYEVAFKLGTILGIFFMPVGAYLMLKLMRFDFPIPVAGAIVMVSFLFMDSYTIYGGNIPSAMAGEYSFSLSVGLCMVFLGLSYRSATEQRSSPFLAAVVLASAVLSHLIPVMVTLLALPVVILWGARPRGIAVLARRFGVVLGVAFAFTAFWSIPFLARLGYTANMGWTPVDGLAVLFPREIWIYVAAAVFGALIAATRADRRFLLLLAPAILGALLYFLVPQGHVWNGRFIPFWYLGVYLCAAYMVGSTVPILARQIRRRRIQVVAVALTAGVFAAVGGWTLWNKGESFIDFWIEYNYDGYEKKPDYDVFQRIVSRLDGLPPGRVMWEPSNDLGRFGTPIAFMSIPYWTNQSSMEGIYFESSFTTPFHFMLAAEVAQNPSNPVGGLPYSQLDLEQGANHMEMFDIDYYLAHSASAISAADESDRLAPIDEIEDFKLYAVDTPGQVVVPEYQPVVLEETDWTDANVQWFKDVENIDVPLTSDGPSDWDRASIADGRLPRVPLEHGGESFPSRMSDDAITFSTTAIGEPHWIKTSYFPNWKVEGADGPYLASPSLMMVVPTQSDVTLRYERTWAEWLGVGLTLMAISCLLAPPSRRFLREMSGS
ncbi:MAG: 6-pyruvoyl-tetrahydropterin synthase-related protein [Actinomycetota bacterium]